MSRLALRASPTRGSGISGALRTLVAQSALEKPLNIDGLVGTWGLAFRPRSLMHDPVTHAP